MKKDQQKLLIFGGSGAIGQAITEKFKINGWLVYVVTRKPSPPHEKTLIVWDVLNADQPPSELSHAGPFDAVVWAQGDNLNDSIYSFNRLDHEKIYAANVTFILESLHTLLDGGLLTKPAHLCVLSSIWQDVSRQCKLSYSVSKSALHGLVLALANDMAVDGHLVNAVLPGAIDTPMTRQNLSPEQIKKIAESTYFKKLPQLGDVTNAVYFLCSKENTGITGQFMKVDLGFSDVRNF